VRVLAAFATVIGAAFAQLPGAIPIEQRGPAIGSKIPGLHVSDQAGRMRDFDSLRGSNGLVLLFVRSADW